MTHNRLKQLVLLVSTANGDVWLTTFDELQDQYTNRDERIPHGLFASELTVYEIAGGAVTGPLGVKGDGAGTGQDKLVFSYPDGRIAFRLLRETDYGAI